MSWLYSQALVEEYLVENFSDGEPSAPLNGNPIQQAYLSPDKMMDFSRLSRFGMTYKPLTENLGEELLTLYLAGFHAKTSLQQEKGQELEESVVDCGSIWQESLEKSNHDMLTLKTPLCSALEDSVLSSKTLPRWGTMLSGVCYQQQMLVQTTKEKGCGLWPTPTVQGLNGGSNSRNAAIARGLWITPTSRDRKGTTITKNHLQGFNNSLANDVIKMPKATPATVGGGKLNPTWVEWLMGWPLGWTDLKPLVMDKSHFAQQQHLNY
jgi:hypothetical protein